MTRNRFVYGAGTDEVLTRYIGSTTSDRRYIMADEKGSTVNFYDSSGVTTNINTYDDYGRFGVGNGRRHQYTGQVYFGRTPNLYYYKARFYNPELGIR